MALTRLKLSNQLQTAAQGSLITYNVSSEQSTLAPGSNGTVLTIVGGVPAWQTPGALSGTVNQIPYFNTTSTIATEAGSGANSLTWDPTNNRLGVQQAAPQSILHVGNAVTSGTVGANAIILTDKISTTANIGNYSIITGGNTGTENSVVGTRCAVLGGETNAVSTAVNNSAILGGSGNTIAASNSAVIGSLNSTVNNSSGGVILASSTSSFGSGIPAGSQRAIIASLSSSISNDVGESVVLGGNNNALTTYIGQVTLGGNGLIGGSAGLVSLGAWSAAPSGATPSITSGPSGGAGYNATAFLIGNGTGSGARSNAYEITWDGVHKMAPTSFSRTTDPSSPQAGWMYYNTSTNKLRLYDGTTWVDLN